MTTLNNSLLIYNDLNYTHAINYQHMYNAPITLNYGPKHERIKYILPSGNGDVVTLLQDGVYIYVLSQNNVLNYISMIVINTESKEIEGDVYLSGDDIELEDSFSYGILDNTKEKQVQILFTYIN